jgi:hypothetical protein
MPPSASDRGEVDLCRGPTDPFSPARPVTAGLTCAVVSSDQRSTNLEDAVSVISTVLFTCASDGSNDWRCSRSNDW